MSTRNNSGHSAHRETGNTPRSHVGFVVAFAFVIVLFGVGGTFFTARLGQSTQTKAAQMQVGRDSNSGMQRGKSAKRSNAKSVSAITSAAVERAGYTVDEVSEIAVKLVNDNPDPYYTVSFTANGADYSYDLDAYTGLSVA